MKTFQKVVFGLVSLVLYGTGMLGGILLYRIINAGEITGSISTATLATSIIMSVAGIGFFVLFCWVFVCFLFIVRSDGRQR